MSFKYGRGDNLFSKTNRVDRFKQMSKQQQLIEEKKRQIQEKQELVKKKEAEDALKKTSIIESNVIDKKSLVFSNDGTFLDQFRKLSGQQAQGNLIEDKDGDKFALFENKEGDSNYESNKLVEVDEGNKLVKPEIFLPPLPPVPKAQSAPNHLSLPKPTSSFQPHQQLLASQPHQQLLASQPQSSGLPPNPSFQQQPKEDFILFSILPPLPPPPMMPQNIPPPIIPQSIPPPIIPQSIPPPSPMNVQNIPPPPLNIPPPPLPPRYPPPIQFPVNPLPPSIPNLCTPPPIFNSHQVPAEKIQGNTKSEPFNPVVNKMEPDSKEWFSKIEPKSIVKTNETTVKTKEELKCEILQLKKEYAEKHKHTEIKKEPAEIQNELVEIKKERLCIKVEQEESNQELLDEIKFDLSDNELKFIKAGERKRKSRWSDEKDFSLLAPASLSTAPKIKVTGMSGHMISKVTRTDPGLLQYAMTAYGSSCLAEEDWKKAEENYKVHLLYQDMMAKRAELEKLKDAGKNKYEYDSDEEIDEKGTWEHKLREKEMVATCEWAESLTEMAKGKHHIGDFLPPDELKNFMAKYQAAKGGGEPDLSDYKEYKLGEENKGFQMLQKLGWTEGQGLGSDGAGILDPINKGKIRDSSEGLGLARPDDVSNEDDEYDAYRKRMMLAYRFRPNPLNNPRRPYY